MHQDVGMFYANGTPLWGRDLSILGFGVPKMIPMDTKDTDTWNLLDHLGSTMTVKHNLFAYNCKKGQRYNFFFVFVAKFSTPIIWRFLYKENQTQGESQKDSKANSSAIMIHRLKASLTKKINQILTLFFCCCFLKVQVIHVPFKLQGTNLDCRRVFTSIGYNENPSFGFNILYFWPEISQSVLLIHLSAVSNKEAKGIISSVSWASWLTCFIAPD